MIGPDNTTSRRANAPIARRVAPIFYFLFSVLAFSQSAGCGAPGEPSERKSPIPVAVTDLAATQQGNDVILTFTLPKESIERKPLKHLPAVEIYRSFEPRAASAIPSAPPAVSPASALVVTIPAEMVGHFANRDQFRYVDTLTAENFSENPADNAVYFVRTRTSPKKVSAYSNPASLAIQPAPDPITDLNAEITRQAIVLAWSPPQRTLIGVAPPIATYGVYRAESEATPTASAAAPPSAGVAEQKPLFAHIADVSAPPFHDSQIQFGKKYVYSVRSVAQYDHACVDSADSNLVSVVRLDTFPPFTPEGLVAAFVPAEDRSPAYFDLSWSISADNDIAGYNIYRSEGTSTARTKLNAALLLTPAFRDMNVLPGRRYLYTVTAVSGAGNESLESAAASGAMPVAAAPAESQPQ